MKHSNFLSIALAVGITAAATAVASSTITATFDAKGHHPANAPVRGPTTIKCVSAYSNQGHPAACFIRGPGVAQQVAKGQSVGTSGAGTVTLTCDGQGTFVSCSAAILN